MFSSSGEFNGHTQIYITDSVGNKLKEIEVFIETYENDSKVEEFITIISPGDIFGENECQLRSKRLLFISPASPK